MISRLLIYCIKVEFCPLSDLIKNRQTNKTIPYNLYLRDRIWKQKEFGLAILIHCIYKLVPRLLFWIFSGLLSPNVANLQQIVLPRVPVKQSSANIFINLCYLVFCKVQATLLNSLQHLFTMVTPIRYH